MKVFKWTPAPLLIVANEIQSKAEFLNNQRVKNRKEGKHFTLGFFFSIQRLAVLILFLSFFLNNPVVFMFCSTVLWEMFLKVACMSLIFVFILLKSHIIHSILHSWCDAKTVQYWRIMRCRTAVILATKLIVDHKYLVRKSGMLPFLYHSYFPYSAGLKRCIQVTFS